MKLKYGKEKNLHHILDYYVNLKKILTIFLQLKNYYQMNLILKKVL